MVQPMNYLINAQSPLQAFGQAAQFGAGLAEMDARRQAAQQEAIRTQSLNQEFQRVSAIQSPQAKDFMALSFLLPPAQMESVRKTFELGSEEQKNNQLSFAGKVLSAFTTGNNQIGIDLLLNRAVMLRKILAEKIKLKRFALMQSWQKLTQAQQKQRLA
jgi:hypothetical protein